MASSRAIKKRRDDTALSNYQPMPERAPSVERAETPTVARVVAMIGLFFTVLGILAMFAGRMDRKAFITPDWGFRFATVGVMMILYHAFIERDLQFRRLYGFLALVLVVGGVALRLIAFKAGPAGDTARYMTWFYIYGLPALTVGLIIVFAVVRNETELPFRNLLLNTVGIEGALLIVFSVFMGLKRNDFLAGEGIVLLVLGLLYLGVYIGQQEVGSERAYQVSLGLGGAGILGLVISLVCSFMPDGSFLSPYNNFFIPNGLILMGMSAVYLAVSLSICVDWPVILLARRELAAYFYSPIGYLVFIGMTLMGAFTFGFFADRLIPDDPRRQAGAFEPIVGEYVFSIWVVFIQSFIIAALTMRLVSEEKRTGTLEVLMTAPVNEISVVLGKFFACWIFYMLTWIPFWIYLVAMRYIGGEEFDYRPLLSFNIALALTGAGLLSMGLFFSSMTSNQIIAAVLTFVLTMQHLVFYFLRHQQTIPEGSAWNEILRYVNTFDLWLNSLNGTVSPRYLMFHVSITIFFLFATVKILESRKWK